MTDETETDKPFVPNPFKVARVLNYHSDKPMTVNDLIAVLVGMPGNAIVTSFVHHDDDKLTKHDDGSVTLESMEAFRDDAFIRTVQYGQHAHPQTREVMRDVVELGP